jgi:hypothetical protein
MMKSPCEGCQKACPENGCAEWRHWFRENWSKSICRRANAEPPVRQCFQYEHPDRVREQRKERGE